jgi:hypothetical protein
VAYLTGEVLTEANIAALFTSGTYTPTLVGMVIGTGGTPTNSAKYTFVGFPAGGVLTVEGKIKFGTSGQTFPAATATISLPSGYSMIDTEALAPINAAVVFSDVSPVNVVRGAMQYSSATTVRLIAVSVSGSYTINGATGTTIPFTWASNDEIYYHFSVRCTGP